VVEVVLVVPVPAPCRFVVVDGPVPPTPPPGRDGAVVVGPGGDPVVAVVVVAGGAVVVVAAGAVVVVGGGAVVVVVVVDPRQRPGARHTFPRPVPPDAAPVPAGGYRYHRVPKPRKATTINSVDRRIGSHRCTRTDM
jgi:hypothetical protein